MPIINVYQTIVSIYDGTDCKIRELSEKATEMIETGKVNSLSEIPVSEVTLKPMDLKSTLLTAFDVAPKPDSYKKADSEFKLYRKISEATEENPMVEFSSEEITILKDKAFQSQKKMSMYFSIKKSLEG